MNRKLAIIIGLQALLIIMLFWVLVFYGKDEYEAYSQSQEEEIETPQRVLEKEGQSIITVPVAAQKNSGISTAKLASSQYQNSGIHYGSVVSIDTLIEAKARLNLAKAEADLARAGTSANIEDFKRLKLLNEDNKNVSDRVVQTAESLVKADIARIKNADTNVQTIQKTIQLQWGDTLAKLVTDQSLPEHLAGLLSRKYVLVQLSLPNALKIPAKDAKINLQSLGDSATIIATYVAPAVQSDMSNYGATYFYSAPADRLRVGMRVKTESTSHQEKTQSSGVIVPNAALVWYGGKPWVYLKQTAESFVRKPMNADNEVAGGWFNTTGFNADDEIVVSGAQLLLSEEFKYLIKNENDD